MAHLFDQPSTNETIKWRADSNYRGSFSILSTCTITLFLGVWSAVHLNLPGNPRIWHETFLRRMAWIFCSLFMPEILILTAWTQRKAVKRVQVQVEKIFVMKGQKVYNAEAQRPTLNNKWTMTHSFWAIMGGIGGDGVASEPFIPSDIPPKLTEKGIAFLLQTAPELLPDVAEGEVKDKSKGDWLTKSLACIQATWFCISCLVRVGQSLPLSLLELNTFAHALCTIVVYFIWWHKPLDVERPLLITSLRMRPLLAYMWMASKTSARPKIKRNGDTTYTVSRAPEFEAIKLGTDLQPPQHEITSTSDRNASGITTVTPSTGLEGTNFFVNQSSARWRVEECYSSRSGSEYEQTVSWQRYRYDPAVFKLTPLDVRRWKLAHEALQVYRLDKPTEDQGLVTVKPVPETFDSPTGMAEGSSIEITRQIWAMLGFCVLAAAYGALHALAWNARFPTRRQRILWRVSSLVIASPAGVGLVIVVSIMCVGLFVHTTRWITQSVHRVERAKTSVTAPDTSSRIAQPCQDTTSSKKSSSFRVPVLETPAWDLLKGVVEAVFGISLMVLYIPARAYVVGESFRMAFYLPPDAFRTTQWEKFFPHFG